MINNTNNFEESRTGQEANRPGFSADKLKDYGQKSLAPIIEVLHKYQGEIGPYFSAISQGLQGGADALRKPLSDAGAGAEIEAEVSSDANRVIAEWFQDAADWLRVARQKIDEPDKEAILNYIQDEARRRPGFIFSASYMAGLLFGRLGRHIGKYAIKDRQSFQDKDQAINRNAGDEDLNYGEQPLTH